jgi:hypothetical protein
MQFLRRTPDSCLARYRIGTWSQGRDLKKGASSIMQGEQIPVSSACPLTLSRVWPTITSILRIAIAG